MASQPGEKVSRERTPVIGLFTRQGSFGRWLLRNRNGRISDGRLWQLSSERTFFFSRVARVTVHHAAGNCSRRGSTGPERSNSSLCGGAQPVLDRRHSP